MQTPCGSGQSPTAPPAGWSTAADSPVGLDPRRPSRTDCDQGELQKTPEHSPKLTETEFASCPICQHVVGRGLSHAASSASSILDLAYVQIVPNCRTFPSASAAITGH